MLSTSNFWWLPTIALVVSRVMTIKVLGFFPCSQSQSVSTPQEGTTASSRKLKELKPWQAHLDQAAQDMVTQTLLGHGLQALV